jgi:hypothetical protein
MFEADGKPSPIEPAGAVWPGSHLPSLPRIPNVQGALNDRWVSKGAATSGVADLPTALLVERPAAAEGPRPRRAIDTKRVPRPNTPPADVRRLRFLEA